MHQAINWLMCSIQHSRTRQLLPFTLASVLMISIPAQAEQNNGRCEGFRFVRDRSDHEAPLLPRQSIAASAIWSPDRCAQPRSSEQQSHQRAEEAVLNSNASESSSRLELDEPLQTSPSEITPQPLR